MLIHSPVDRADEVPALIDAGAEELYAGFVPPFWAEAFGPLVSSNRRTYNEANVPSVEELEAVVREAALRGVPVFLALNAAPIPDAMIRPMAGFVEEAAAFGIRGIIVSDLPLLVALRDRRFRRLQLHASTLFSAFNSAAVAFFRRAGASRVILPRELTVGEIAAMVPPAGETALEVIGMRGRCPNVEGFCTHLHDDPDRTWPCELRYEKAWRGPGTEIPPEILEPLERNEAVDRYYSCGLCAIPLLERAGVHAFKLVGRGAEIDRKAAAVAAAGRMRAWGREAIPDAPGCARRGKELYREIFGRACRPENCYFPEFGPGKDGIAPPEDSA